MDGSGLLLDSSIPDMTRSEILNHLKKYGFIIQFTEKTEITEKQLYMLRGLYDMGYLAFMYLSQFISLTTIWYSELRLDRH